MLRANHCRRWIISEKLALHYIYDWFSICHHPRFLDLAEFSAMYAAPPADLNCYSFINRFADSLTAAPSIYNFSRIIRSRKLFIANGRRRKGEFVWVYLFLGIFFLLQISKYYVCFFYIKPCVVQIIETKTMLMDRTLFCFGTFLSSNMVRN